MRCRGKAGGTSFNYVNVPLVSLKAPFAWNCDISWGIHPSWQILFAIYILREKLKEMWQMFYLGSWVIEQMYDLSIKFLIYIHICICVFCNRMLHFIFVFACQHCLKNPTPLPPALECEMSDEGIWLICLWNSYLCSVSYTLYLVFCIFLYLYFVLVL